MMVNLSDDGANQVLFQLARNWYYLDQEPLRQDDGEIDGDDDSFETYQQWMQRQQKRETCAFNDDSISFQSSGRQLIPTEANGNGCYFTPKGLVRHLIGRLEQGNNDGRASLFDLCSEIQVDSKVFLSATSVSGSEEDAGSPTPWDQLVAESKSLSITILGSNKVGTIRTVELVSVSYWERTLEQVTAMVEEKGIVSILDLMAMFSFSRDAIINHLVEAKGKVCSDKSSSGKIRLMDDSKHIVSDWYFRSLQQRVVKHFARLEEPTQIKSICHEQHWNYDQVLEWIEAQLQHQIENVESVTENKRTMPEKMNNNEKVEFFLEGEIHGDTATCDQTAIYLPTSYRKRQKQEILEFIASNGYITLERAVRNYRQGLLAAQITSLVQDAFSNVTVLRDGQVFVTDSILQQVQLAIQENLSPSSSASKILDLQDYLPADLLQSPTIVLSILEKSDFSSPSDGVAVIGNDRTILVGKEVIQNFKDDHLSQLIQSHAKNCANEIFQSDFAMDEDDDDNEDLEGSSAGRKTGKSKRAKRKNKNFKHSNKKNKFPKESASAHLLPLPTIVSAVLATYPIFDEDAPSFDDSKAGNMKWEDDDDDYSLSLAAQFCRKAFYSQSFIDQCNRAVNAELKRLESEKNSKAKMSRKDAAAKVRNVETSFQDAFRTLCYLIQAQSKSVTFLIDNLEDCDDGSCLEKLKAEFLQGPCADLTSRVTQHCLYREEAEEDCMFTFVPPDRQGEENDNNSVTDDASRGTEQLSSSLPQYCTDVIITARHHPQSYLSSPPPREPLPILRESFSGNTGIVLSKMWILCGGECYRGGIRTVADDDVEFSSQSVYVRPGNMDAFSSYAEENCLTLCGLPYKKLDKKAEKSLLFSRKQQLCELLASTEVAIDPTGILEYTIMILFQQVRSLIVTGSLLRGPILEALSRERKIPSSVAEALKTLDSMIKDDDKTVDEELGSLVKECGLVRDISKHDTSPLETILQRLRS